MNLSDKFVLTVLVECAIKVAMKVAMKFSTKEGNIVGTIGMPIFCLLSESRIFADYADDADFKSVPVRGCVIDCAFFSIADWRGLLLV